MTIPFSVTAPSKHIAYGEKTFTSVGNTTWNVPEGVTAVSIVCIGGGGGQNSTTGGGGGALAYVNAASVTPGEALTITVGAAGTTGSGGASLVKNAATTTLVQANGGSNAGTGGTVATGTGFAGGAGGSGGAGSRGGGGGGAGGFAGIGGSGGAGASGGTSGSTGTGGSGGGGQGTGTSNSAGSKGGGVGIELGQGINGTGDTSGAGGGAGSIPFYNSLGSYGGGAGGNGGGGAQQGVVKIIWYYPTFGATRSFPATKIIDSSDFKFYCLSTTVSSGSTLTIPAHSQTGDVAVLFDTASNATTVIPTTTTPSGFTTINDASVSNFTLGNAVRSVCSYKVLVGTEANTSITGMNGGDANSKVLVLFRPNQPLSPSNTLSLTVSTPGSQATTGASPSNQTISMSGLDPTNKNTILYFANYRTGRGNSVSTRGATGPTFTEQVGSSSVHYVKFGDFKASDTDIDATISMTSTATASYQILQSFYMLFSIT